MFTRFCATLAKTCMMIAVAGLVAIIACVTLQVDSEHDPEIAHSPL